jgi:hypothetical protein
MRIVAAWLLILFIVGCTDRTKVPKGIVKQDKMEKVLWDMMLVDRYATSFIMSQPRDSFDVKKQQTMDLYEQVFRLNHISREDFIKSYKFYLTRPDLTKTMFDSISSRADRQRDQLYRSNPPRASLLSKRDSLRRVDSIRRADSIEKIDLAKPSTEELFADSVLDKKK